MAIVVRKAQVLVSVLLLLLGVLLVTAAPSFAATPTFGELYYNGDVVGTLVPPAEMPREGVDDLYAILNQLAVTAPLLLEIPTTTVDSGRSTASPGTRVSHLIY
jgi:hypothetical protein